MRELLVLLSFPVCCVIAFVIGCAAGDAIETRVKGKRVL